MAKYVVRRGKAILEIEQDTRQENFDKRWLEHYNKFISYVKEHGHQKFQSPKREYFNPDEDFLRRWVGTQRILYKKGKLAFWRYEMLVKMNFLFEPIEEQWQINYNKLVEYKNKYGHCNIPRNDKHYAKLCKWISGMRYHKERLTVKKIKMLDEIGFNWGEKRNSWNYMYKLLKKYFDRFGVSYISRGKLKDKPINYKKKLNRWIGKQITRYNEGKLSEKRIDLLRKINFEFNYKKIKEEREWQKNFNELKKFKRKFGHFNVPVRWHENKYIAYWVQRIRVYKSQLTPEKVQQLDDIGFNWSYYEEHFEKHFQSLKEYFIKNGHCNVLLSEDEKLTNWIRYLRKVRKGMYDYKLSEVHIKRLDEIDFVWDPRDLFWENSYQKLIEYKELNGHCNVKKNEDNSLFLWCRTNRYNKDKLSKDKIERLDALGFNWETKRKMK
ncbi:MAG TPA: helicase associated domain-containing protein [Candidatus Kapabacteria bacterium]|nr:helicase associated domain-containing protein [Candidatus Kapabacteria bacterium]HPO63176.1 helicase associated domain-containing protein [Candidatus Kapabacteria bacterium]